jgi:hypothetical protein
MTTSKGMMIVCFTIFFAEEIFSLQLGILTTSTIQSTTSSLPTAVAIPPTSPHQQGN